MYPSWPSQLSSTISLPCHLATRPSTAVVLSHSPNYHRSEFHLDGKLLGLRLSTLRYPPYYGHKTYQP